MHTLLDERDKVEIESQIQKISNNSIVSKKAGSSIVVYDSAGNKPRGLRVLGKTEQKSYTGKNLFPFATVGNTKTVSGLTVTFTEEGAIVNGMAEINYIRFFRESISLPAGSYRVLGGNTDAVYAQVDVTNADGTRKHYFNTTFTIDGTEQSIIINLQTSTLEEFKGTLSNYILYPVLMESSIQNTNFEPYVGGTASPNQECPQELVNAGDSGNVEVGLYGGNLVSEFANAGVSTAYYGALWCKFDLFNDTEYTISFIGAVGHKFYTNEQLFELKRVTSDGSRQYVTVKSNKTFSDVANNYREEMGWKVFKNNGDNTVVPLFTDVQIELGSTATPYKPYHKQSLSIPTPNGLPGIKVTDASLATYIDENGQMWCSDEKDYERGVYIQRVWKGKPLKNVVFTSRNENGRCSMFGMPFGLRFADGNIQSMSTIALWSNYGAIEDGTFALALSGIYYKDSTKTLEEVNAMFAKLGTNFEVLGVLETPIETPLSEEEIAQYRALTMNHPTATILNDSNAHMEVSYVANTQNHIEQNYLTKDEFESLKTRISSIAKNII